LVDKAQHKNGIHNRHSPRNEIHTRYRDSIRCLQKERTKDMIWCVLVARRTESGLLFAPVHVLKSKSSTLCLTALLNFSEFQYYSLCSCRQKADRRRSFLLGVLEYWNPLIHFEQVFAQFCGLIKMECLRIVG
jgi:hypothetical protein